LSDHLGSKPQPGMDRRAIIKRAAAAGAVAWTAPLLVDSFASPAAAATLATGCYRLQFSHTTCGEESPSSTANCFPTSWETTLNTLLAGTASCAGQTGSVITLGLGDSDCVFVRGTARATGGGNECVAGVGGGTTTMTFTKTANNWNNNVRAIVACGGITTC
jgi:hypothetical protein